MQPNQSFFPPSPGFQSYSLLSLPLELSRMMETFMSGAAGLTPLRSPMDLLSSVRLDVTEDESAWQLVAEMPGIQLQDIDVELDGRELRISGHKGGESRSQVDQVHLNERSFGHFSRTVVLPFQADVEKVCADFCNGVLTLHVPKPAALRRTQHIHVRDRSRDGQLTSVPSTHMEPSADGVRPGIGAMQAPGTDAQTQGDVDQDEAAADPAGR